MNVDQRAWDLIPDFSERLAEAMGRAGLGTRELCERLQGMGIQTGERYLRVLLRGGPTQLKQSSGEIKVRPKPNPSLLFVAGCALACDAPVQLFFAQSVLDVPVRESATDAFSRGR